MKKFVFVLVASIILSGCYKITLQNGGRPLGASYKQGEWHHDGVAGLVEFSEPVDMKNRCEGRNWDSVKIHQTFVQGLVSGVTYGLYNPWDVAYSCR